MKLYGTTGSPYARKARVCAHELGLADRIEFVVQAPRDNAGGYWNVNPLARIPALVLDDGSALYDSPVICEYLNALAGGALIPASGPARFDALRRQALGDGIPESGVPLRGELARAPELHAAEYIDRYKATIDRALDAIDREPATVTGGPVDVGAIACACAIGWLAYRFPDWRIAPGRPRLAAWYAAILERPSFRATRPDA